LRALALSRIAAEAELILIGRLLRQAVVRAVMGVAAAIFAVAALIMLHIEAVAALERFYGWQPVTAYGVLLAVDACIAVFFALIAMREAPDPVAVEARRLRDEALRDARADLSLTTLWLRLLRQAAAKW